MLSVTSCRGLKLALREHLHPRNWQALQIMAGFPGGSGVKNSPAKQETWVQSLDQEDPLEKGMATHSSILAWKIPWTEEPGGLQFMALQRVRYDLATKQQQQIMASPPLPESLLNIYSCSVPVAVTSQ